MPGNPDDGHTRQECLEQAEQASGIEPKEAYTDRGYRDHGGITADLKVWIAGARRGVTGAIHRKLKRRNAVVPVIGRMKCDDRLARNFVKGVAGDAVNALLYGAGHNLRTTLRKMQLLGARWGSQCATS